MGLPDSGDDRLVDVTVRRLRVKLENDPSQPELLSPCAGWVPAAGNDVRALGLRGRVILGFAAGALLLSVMVTLVTDVVSARYLVDQRERAASRQAVVNGIFVESRLTRDGADPSGALGAVRLGTGAEAVLVAPEASASTAIGLTTDDLPAELVAATEAGQPSVQISRSGGTPVVAVGVPLQDGYAYYEVTELENLDTTLQTIIWAGVAAALMTSLLGAGLGWWAASRVLRPLNDVAQAATKLAAGDLDARAPTTTDPDLTAISSSFNAMAETLATRIQRDAQFAADVSHELRSPLTTMTASASVLESRRAELPSVARRPSTCWSSTSRALPSCWRTCSTSPATMSRSTLRRSRSSTSLISRRSSWTVAGPAGPQR